MTNKRTVIPNEDIERQLSICKEIKNSTDCERLALVDTFGCQQNEEDSEKIRGYLTAMGYKMTEDKYKADVIILNTCAVREHAEMRVFGNLGDLSHTKKKNPNQIIAVCGCMVQQQHITDKIKRSFHQVDLVFAPDELWRFPELFKEILNRKKRIFALDKGNGRIAEGLPHLRQNKVKAWLSVMYGCNNFCTYCIVPYTRLRERSRTPEEIIKEAKELVSEGYKEITLLGQNVNSYGKDLENKTTFAELIRMINDIDGDFVIRFMTSHPKDANEDLFKAMAECEKCETHLHLPLQSGSDRILKAMNRCYTAKKYLSLVKKAREYMPDIVLTTDIIVGFPNETDEDFEETLKVVEKVRYDAMFTFIYSKRVGTPAAKMDDPFTREDKQVHFDQLIELQNKISDEKHKAYIGKSERVLVDGKDREEGILTSRNKGGRLVRFKGDESLIGTFVDIEIDDCNTWALRGKIKE